MNYMTPESRGISSKKIQEYIEILEKNGLATHDLLIARGDSVIFEKYWAPFHRDFLHRMYSVSKSFVSIAVGFLEQDGRISLDDEISKYFEAELEGQEDVYMRRQTIRHMLMMCTAKLPQNWFEARPDDRVRFYFQNDETQSRPSGTIFQYDSTGSFVLGALVERLTGKPFMEYLREKLFDRIGVSAQAYCLKCPGGHSWGDSGVLCRPLDLLKTARFVMNGGRWEGEQILGERYLREAVSRLVDTNFWDETEAETFGYGYQIWRAGHNSYFFNGMGCQLALCVPDKDVIMVYNGDNQGKASAKKIILDHFFSVVLESVREDGAGGEEKPQSKGDGKEYEELEAYCAGLSLAAAKGEMSTPCQDEVDGVVYELGDNPMGIASLELSFSGDSGVLRYVNGQGEKELPFGMCRNVFGQFPQEGYSDEVGSVEAPGNTYRCAASAAWVKPGKLHIKVQIIDKYFGNLHIFLGFRENLVGVYMNKSAEDFLEEYSGFAGGIAREKT